MDSGLLAEFIIGPRYARTRWLGPGMTKSISTPSSIDPTIPPNDKRMPSRDA
jgi:hypothetical protein